MTDFTPSAAQAQAIREIRDWFETRTAEQQVYRMFGYAGSGKSTVLRFALDELGLSPHQGERDGGCVPGVVTATFTGKAAHVLRGQGHAGAHHPQPDLQCARGDRGGGRGRGEEDPGGRGGHPHP